MDVIRAFVAPAEAIEGHPDAIRGVASTVGNADRAKRAFLPGAFGIKPKRVPLLAFHDATQPIGSSVLTPTGNVLLHESTLANLPEAERFRELIRVGAIPATSIGWVDQGSFQGWSALERGNPTLARAAAAAGVVKREDVVYYERAEIVENSLVPIPSNPMALLAVAGMMPEGTVERAILEDLIEMAAGSRHSQSDQAHLQMAHDHLAAVGAVCAIGDKNGASSNGVTGGWQKYMRSTLYRVAVQQAADTDPDEDPGKLVQAIDQAIDDAIEDHGQGNDEQAWTLIVAAAATVDTLLKVLNVPDADEVGMAMYEALDQIRQHPSDGEHAQQMAAVAAKALDHVREVVGQIETAVVWTTQYINDLPDTAFAYVEPDCDTKGCRHFPHHNADGSPDEAHVRNALARIPQSDVSAEAKAAALAHVEAHARKLGIAVGDSQSALPSMEQLTALELQVAALDK